MDLATYAVEAEVEATHWWFVVRRRLIGREIEKLGLPTFAAALDIGTSTGTNLRLLRELGFTNVRGLDQSLEAIRFCAQKGLGQVEQGDACALPFADASFDLVLATDIIEHVDDDAKAVAEIARVLKPGGFALFTVPAFESIWGLQDQVAHHKRRYRKARLAEPIKRADFRLRAMFYFNTFLFAPIWLARRAIGFLGLKLQSEAQVNTPALNWVLRQVFALDAWFAPANCYPFGVSILAVAQKPSG